MNLKRTLLVVLPLSLGIGLWLGYRIVNAQVDIVAAFEARCLVPMGQGESPDLAGLKEVSGLEPDEARQQAGLLSGSVVLTHRSVQDPKSEGCIITDALAPLQDVRDKVAGFDSWADAATLTGRYSDVENCTGDENAYYRVLSSVPAADGEVPVRIVMTAYYPDPFYALTAATGAEMGLVCS